MSTRTVAGLVPVEPPIHSSDYELCLGDPFLYFLTRRLGLRSALYYSASANRGSWMHACLEHDQFDQPIAAALPAIQQGLTKKLNARIAELRANAAQCGITGDTLSNLLAQERQDADTAMGVYVAAGAIRINDQHASFRDYLSNFKVLAREETIRYSPSHGGLGSVGIMDLLLADKQDRLWIADLKSCDHSPQVRLATCPVEYQPQHYLWVLRQELNHWEALNDPSRPKWTCGHDSRSVMGMIHIALRVPDIIFGQKDRPYRETDKTITRGPRKGQVDKVRTYYGEADIKNYIKRCRDWLVGDGEYQDKRPERATDPCVNISTTLAEDLLDADHERSYASRTTFIRELATRDPDPETFLKSASNMRPYGKLSTFAPFYVTPPEKWPDVITKLGLRVAHRDPECAQENPPVQSVA